MSEEIKSGLISTVGEIVKDVVSPSAKIIGSWLGEALSVNYSQWRAEQAAKVVTETSLDDEELSVNTESITNIYTDTEVIRLTRLGKSFVKACRGSSF